MEISSSWQFSEGNLGAILRVTGEDAASFLQGQFTNELSELTIGAAVYGLWLNQKGKVLADSFVLRGGQAGEFLVVSYCSPASGLRQRLEDYIIADDVIVEDLTAEWTSISLLGSGASAWFGQEKRVGFGVPGRRAKDENWTWVFPSAERDRVRVQLGACREIDVAELERRRIAASIPAVPADIGPGDLPGEGGLESVAISYTKGCYLGQEVMARLKSMGQVRRRLRRVRGPGGVPTVPLPLWQEGRQVGELRSVVATAEGFAGMAMLSLINLRPELPLALEVAGSAEIALLPEER